MNQSINKIFFALVVVQLALFGCISDRDQQLLEPGEANVRILAALAAKDSVCKSTHVLTLPVAFKVEKDDIENCIFQIFEMDCAEWETSGGGAIPVTCGLLAVQWK